MSQDIFIEVGHGPTLIDNNIMLSKASCRLATQGVALVHNLILGAFTSVGGGVDSTVNGKNQPRYTPYHIRHRTEVAGFMSILHGDNRFYNNIFVQNWKPSKKAAKEDMGFVMKDNEEVGNAVWDEYPTYKEWISKFDFNNEPNMMALGSVHFDHLPVWAEGNVYLNGAKAWKKEKNCLVDKKSKVKVELKEKKGKYFLETNIYDIIKDYNCNMINSDILGYAFEPEERFENTDGTDIVFNKDYLEEHRGERVLPGPFASKEAAAKQLNVILGIEK